MLCLSSKLLVGKGCPLVVIQEIQLVLYHRNPQGSSPPWMAEEEEGMKEEEEEEEVAAAAAPLLQQTHQHSQPFALVFSRHPVYWTLPNIPMAGFKLRASHMLKR